MPVFRVTGPDGKTYRINAPEGATADQAIAYVQQQAKAAPAWSPAQEAAFRESVNPAGSQGFGENLLQGTGRGMASVLRAVGGGKLAEKMGLPGTKAESERLDAPLLD